MSHVRFFDGALPKCEMMMDLDTTRASQSDDVTVSMPVEDGKSLKTIPILIVNDEPVIIEGLKQMLAAAFPSMTFGHVEDSRDITTVLKQQPWAAVVLVCGSPGSNDLTALQEIRQANPHVPVLVMGSYAEGECTLCAIRAGASGCVTKKAAPEELAQAIRKLITDGCYLGPVNNHREIADALGPVPNLPPQELFSGREFQVVGMILAGKTLKEIAFELACSVKTISTYRTRVFQKLNITCDVDLARYALAQGLICGQARSTPSPIHCPRQ